MFAILKGGVSRVHFCGRIFDPQYLGQKFLSIKAAYNSSIIKCVFFSSQGLIRTGGTLRKFLVKLHDIKNGFYVIKIAYEKKSE